MLDGLLNRGFSSKCKSLIKATRTRIEVVRRRAEAKQRFLKEDLAKLLTNGLDINAYGRTEEFLAGLNLLSCYDFIEDSCDYVVKNLSNMQKLSECPEGCREAVASLMFAAARFSDLPELRDVRDLFQQRYGSSLECFVNQKFVEKMSSKPPLMETRLQLLKDIASECSIKWDSRGFELRMTTTPSTTAQAQANKYGHSNGVVDKCSLLDGRGSVAKSDKDDGLPKEMPVGNIDHKMNHGREGNDLLTEESDLHFYKRQEGISNGYKQPNIKGNGTATNHDDIPRYDGDQDRIAKHERRVKDLIFPKVEKVGSSSYRKPVESSGIAYPGQDEAKNYHERELLSREKMSISPNFGGIPRKNEDLLFAHEHGGITGNLQKEPNSKKRVQYEEVDGSKAYHNTPRPPPYVKSSSKPVPPPYVKPKDGNQKTSRRSEHEGPYRGEHLMNPPVPNRVDEINGSDWNKRELDNPAHDGQINGSTRVISHEKEYLRQDDKIPLPKPRSRRKHHKSLSKYDDVSHVENSGTGRRSSSSRRRDQSRKGLQILMDIEHYRKDEEEKMIDRLLLHYSKKPSTYEDVGKSRKNSQACPSHQGALVAGESSHDPKTDGYNVKPEITPPPTRSISLPHVHSRQSGAKKIFARANSFQPDNQAPHVHPKLPDYDDLAAQFAALKGR